MYSVILSALEAQNISKNQFCKDINISKSYINKVFNGSTPMSERMFTSILSLSYLSDEVKEEVTRTRIENKHGENYDLVMYFNEVAKKFEDSLIPKSIKEIALPDEGLMISERNVIVSLAYSLAKHSINSGAVLCSNHTYAQKDIDDALYTAYYERDEEQLEISFIHIIEKPHIFNKNYINCIWSALRYGTVCIKPFATDEKITSSLFQYVMACGPYSLMWNEEYDRALFIHEPALSSAIMDNFLALKEKSVPFSVICMDEATIMTKESTDLFNITSESPIVVCSVPGSCVNELGVDTWTEVVRKDLPEKTANFLIQAYQNYHHFQLENIKKHYIISDSLLSFAKTGRYASISHRYINDFSPELRKKTIDKLKDAFKEDKNFIIDATKIFFPPFVQIDYYQSSTRIHIDSVYRKFHVYNASVIVNHNDNIGSKRFFDALLDYQTNPEALMTGTQIDYTLESLKLLCDN